MHLNILLGLFLLLSTRLFGLFLGFSLSLGFFFGFSCGLLLLLAPANVLVLLLRVDLPLLQHTSEVLNVLISNIEVFLGVFDLLIDLGKNQLFRGLKLLIDSLEPLIQAFHVIDDVLLPDSEVVDFDIKVDLDLVDGTFQEDHLLPFLLVVNLLTFRDFIALIHLE